MKTINQLIITMMICLFSIQAWAQSGKLFNTDNQLSSNLATQVFQDKSGFIWIATRNGLNTYDGYHITVIKKDMSNFLGLNSNHGTLAVVVTTMKNTVRVVLDVVVWVLVVTTVCVHHLHSRRVV